MHRVSGTVAVSLGCALVAALAARAQFGRGSSEWSTSGGDAQRSWWVRNDPKISPASMREPGFALLWQVKLANPARQFHAFTGSAVLLNGYIGYRGFRSLAFMGGGSDAVFALDTDLGRIEWQKRFGAQPQGSTACPGGMTANVARPLAAAFPPMPQPGRGAGRGTAARSAVGEPGEGAVTIREIAANRARMAAAAPPPPPRVAGTASGAGRGPAAPVRMPNYLYAVSGDGRFRSLYVSNGEEAEKPMPFLPPNANAHGLIVMDNAAYVVTTPTCGTAADAVWALDIESGQVASWKPASGGIAGATGPAIAPDGTLYVTTTAGELAALEPKTLKIKHSYLAEQEFASSPVLFQYQEKTLIAAAAKDGRLHLLDSANIAQPLSAPKGAPLANGFAPPALASWQDPSGTRWILAPSAKSIVAWRVVNRDGAPTLEPGWISGEMVAPLAPMVLNGVIFVVSGGVRSAPAVLHALDGTTGKELWNSGRAIVSFGDGSALSAGGTQVYLGAQDGTFYAFGFPMEH